MSAFDLHATERRITTRIEATARRALLVSVGAWMVAKTLWEARRR